jgi:prohibitin 1
VSITHLTFSKEFTKAIEQKQVAEQDAERQMYVVQRADQERKVSNEQRKGFVTCVYRFVLVLLL